MKIAIVHDWLVTYAGAERVLEQIIRLYPTADIFTVVDFLPEDQRFVLNGSTPKTTFIQNLPFAKSKYRTYLPLMPLAIEQLDLSCYDLVISDSHAVAKGILTGPNQIHISYVHSPIRYAWDLQHQYLKESGLEKGIKGWVAKAILHYMRMWDVRTANGVDFFAANSNFIAKRLRKTYRRDATVIYPPVDVEKFQLCENKEDYYITVSRMVPYKKIDLIVEAFSTMTDKKLVVIGDGPDYSKICNKAGRNVILMGFQPSEVLRSYVQRARAFVFAAEEDFGIAPVEAQACGTPVIAYGKGGVLETVNDINSNAPTGVFFNDQSVSNIVEAIQSFEMIEDKIKPVFCRENALRFSVERFSNEFAGFIKDCLK